MRWSWNRHVIIKCILSSMASVTMGVRETDVETTVTDLMSEQYVEL
jgi:hypothetical protein